MARYRRWRMGSRLQEVHTYHQWQVYLVSLFATWLLSG
jgi:hypothetical protein